MKTVGKGRGAAGPGRAPLDEAPFWIGPGRPQTWPVAAPALPSTADLVIVGGGIAGLAAALWGARQGADTVLFERAELASGATSRNIGVMLYGGPLDRADLLDQVCDEEQLSARPQLTGHLSLIDDERYVDIVDREARSRPDIIELLSHAQCEELLGTSISGRYLAGRRAANGMVVNPVQFAFDLATAAVRRGARLVAGHEVTGLRPAGGTVTVEVDGGTVRARAVVIAAAHSAARLVPGLGDVLSARVAHVWSTLPITPSFPMAMALNFGDVYWRQLPGRRILVGGGRGLGWLDSPGSAHPSPPVARFFGESFPRLPAVQTSGHWTGTMACTPDDLPLVGAVARLPGTWLLTGFGGHGLPPALYASRLVVEAALGGTRPADPALARYAPARFPQLQGAEITIRS